MDMLHDEEKLFKKHPEGSAFKVKATPILRRFGIRASSCTVDGVVWPGEIGTVAYFTWTCADGSTNDAAFVLFSRDRRLTLRDAVENCKRVKVEAAE